MPRFYVRESRIENGILKVEGEEVRHIRKVLRLRIGDDLSVFDGSGKEVEGTLVEEGSSWVSVKVRNILPSRRESGLDVVLAQSLLKGEKMDYLIQKATELGVKRVVPFISSRSIPLLERKKRIERQRRWEKIAIGAAKQCGRRIVPEIGPSRTFHKSLKLLRRGCCASSSGRREGQDSKRP